MNCSADVYIKDCCNQENCCEECEYEDCMESCCIFDKMDNCENCKFCIKD